MGTNWRARWRMGSAFSACVLGLSLVLPATTAIAETVDSLEPVVVSSQEESDGLGSDQADNVVQADIEDGSQTLDNIDEGNGTTQVDSLEESSDTTTDEVSGNEEDSDKQDSAEGQEAQDVLDQEAAGAADTADSSATELTATQTADAAKDPSAAAESAPLEASTTTNSWSYEGGNWYFYNASGQKVTGWFVWGTTPQGTTDIQRYWLESDGKLALSRLLSKEETGYWAYARPEGYVVRGKYTTGNKTYLADNDGRLEDTGWVVSNNYDTDDKGNRTYQRYWIDPTSHAAEYTGTYSTAGFAHITTQQGYVARGKVKIGSRTYLANNDGKLEGPGWVVSKDYDGDYQRYWIDTTTRAVEAYTGNYSPSGFVHLTTKNGYVLRGKLNIDGRIYLGNNDGRLEGTGWVVTNAYDGDFQRYWIDPTLYAAVAGYSTDGWAHYTTSQGYVLRGSYAADGRVYLANNDGELPKNKTGWVVTDAYDGSLQRYYLQADATTGVSFPLTGFFNKVLSGSTGKWFYGNQSKGYVVRDKLALAGGILLADNDGLLVENSQKAGWYVGKKYDSDIQRYYLKETDGHLYARTGHFTIGSNHYYGDNNQGYVVRGKLKVNDTVMVLADNDGKMLWHDGGDGWVITSKYDGEPQRYYLVKNGDLMGARLGRFSVDGSNYFGRSDTGYVVRGFYNTRDGDFFYGNNDGVLQNYDFSLIRRAWNKIRYYGSTSKYLIAVDCDNCHTFVFEGRGGNWVIKYDWLCGTGLPQYNGGEGTCRGIYTMGGSGACYNLQEAGSPGWVRGGYQIEWYPYDGIKYFSCFVLDLGFHSTLSPNFRDPNQVGRKISHGCIRLFEENAKWIYYNAVYGTTVVTY